jgi:hypothetical protein
MNNSCKTVDLSQLEIEQQPTFKDILVELNKLRLENGCLKADNSELIKDRDKWRNDYIELHNKIINEESISFENEKSVNNNEGGWTDEEFDTVAKGYAEMSNDYKIV